MDTKYSPHDPGLPHDFDDLAAPFVDTDPQTELFDAWQQIDSRTSYDACVALEADDGTVDAIELRDARRDAEDVRVIEDGRKQRAGAIAERAKRTAKHRQKKIHATEASTKLRRQIFAEQIPEAQRVTRESIDATIAGVVDLQHLWTLIGTSIDDELAEHGHTAHTNAPENLADVVAKLRELRGIVDELPAGISAHIARRFVERTGPHTKLTNFDIVAADLSTKNARAVGSRIGDPGMSARWIAGDDAHPPRAAARSKHNAV